MKLKPEYLLDLLIKDMSIFGPHIQNLAVKMNVSPVLLMLQRYRQAGKHHMEYFM